MEIHPFSPGIGGFFGGASNIFVETELKKSSRANIELIISY